MLLLISLLFGYSIFPSSSPVVDIRHSGGFFSPPWYPTPPGGTTKTWETSYKKASALVSQMTLVEKVNITTGLGWAMGLCLGNTGPVPRLGFPSLCLQDAPLGVRNADKITSFPAGITVAGTWDKELMRKRGEALGVEFKGKGVHVALGPCMGPIGKLPAGGRNWEGFGADPYLQGAASFETVVGIQSQGVIATAKHYIGNEQEHFRQESKGYAAISSNIDDRALHEVYLWPFQDSVKAGVGAVMCSYQKVNNSAACQNSWLQNHVLKDELGFQGFIMSDWLAQMSGVASVLAGLDMTMPGDGDKWDERNPMLGPRLTEAVLNTSVPIDRLNDMATRIVAAWYQLGQDRGYPDVNFSSWTKDTIGKIYTGSHEPPEGVVNKHINVMGDHPNLTRKIAAEAIALLKNDRKTLPLKKPLKIGVYGEDAALAEPGGANVCEDRACNQGTLAVGWGSGTTDFEYLIDPLSAIKKKVESYGGTVTSILQNNNIQSISESAKKQDVCLVFVNADSGEAYKTWADVKADRPDLNAQKGGDELVLAVANNCENTVVVVHSVGPITMEKWVQKPNGNALVDVLWGDVNPSGKLPYTIGKSLSDYGSSAQIITNPTPQPQQDFSDGIFIDYRHFDKEGIEPRYEFGFGLSYTTFSYGRLSKTIKAPITPYPARRHPPESQPPVYNSTIPNPSEATFPPGFNKINRMIYPWLDPTNIIIKGPYPYPDGYNTPQRPSEAGGTEGGNPSLWDVLVEISLTIKNTGNIAGAEAAQLYLEFPQNTPIPFPKRQLRGFQKVYLQPGESKEVKFELTRRDLSYWSVTRQNWVIPPPGFGFGVGASSRKIFSRAHIYCEPEKSDDRE
ncbi:glycoside hydrolase family 3 protein [Trichophaea hybrida]|nr:glycoside hydrolase family 3 protein [Trichophaea hybrida]